MCSASDSMRGEGAQATIEAAFALPVLMLLMLMLLQPAIVLYDRMVMSSAAAEGCRLLSTSGPADREACEDYVRRRLSAIPQADPFHIHGGACSYSIEMTGDEGSSEVSVRIGNRLRPLPLLDVTLSVAGVTDADGALPIAVESSAPTQPDWVGDSDEGRDPGGWVSS